MQNLTLDLTQILVTLISLFGTIAVPILTALAVRFLHLDSQAKSRAVVNTFVENGIALVEAQATGYAKDHGKLKITNENISAVAEYVLPKAQQSLNRLGVKGEGLSQSPADQLGQIIAAKIARNAQPQAPVAAVKVVAPIPAEAPGGAV